MNRIPKITLIILICLLTIAFGCWRYLIAGKTKPAHSSILFDRSESTRSGCDCIARLAKRAMSDPAVTPQSTLSVLAIGNESTANEPTAIAQYPVPVLRQVIKGREAIITSQTEILSDLKARCEKVVTSDRSPIFFTVMRGIEGLRNQGCDSNSDCTLFVVSDGEELVEKSLKQAIDGQKPKGNQSQSLNNAGIRIIFVGVSETNGLIKGNDKGSRQLTRDRDPARAQRLQDAWRERFSNPDQVSFEPFCTISN